MKVSRFFWLLPLLISLSCKEHDKATYTEEGFEVINGSEMYYKIIGSGSPIIVVHGGPVLDHSYFLPQFNELAKDHQLIFYDQRACGKSSIEVDTSSMSIAGFVDDIEQLRTSLKLEKIDLLGHSWGGLLAMHYAIKYPQNLDHLILSNSMPASTEGWQAEEQQLASRITKEDSLSRAAIIHSEEMKNRSASAIKKLMMLSFKTQFHNKNLLDSLNLYIPEDFMDRSAKFSYLGKDLTDFDLYNGLKDVSVPTLIIYGEDEPAATLSGKALESSIPQAQLLVIPKCGHFPFVEQPDVYFQGIKQFIKK
ncbi:proline iminopeptidase-family hydrolase [Fulvivirga sp. 29W222]|uniref:Proline iminopeptidase-family hydrolase n=1 Tax=Fulvivirga marina TaxID=2494733 RepID=A0A937FXV7_9BACT|nr:proline iminopeptidase-family hydrolase [Fulvivirga marina]MBL6448149.1 proline iminopeptidase-family hydrolase [Fulvivirga marina]